MTYQQQPQPMTKAERLAAQLEEIGESLGSGVQFTVVPRRSRRALRERFESDAAKITDPEQT
jgi:hypothetical protein